MNIKKRNSGFSLLEVLVAVVIMAISFTVLVRFEGQAISRVTTAQHLTQATMLAREKMAEVLLQIEKEYIQQRVFPEDKDESAAFDEPFEKFRYEWKIRKVALPVPAGGEGKPEAAVMQMVSDQIKENIREVKLTITWEEGKKERSLDVVTHIAKF